MSLEGILWIDRVTRTDKKRELELQSGYRWMVGLYFSFLHLPNFLQKAEKHVKKRRMRGHPHKCQQDRSIQPDGEYIKIMAKGTIPHLQTVLRIQGRRKLSWAPFIIINTSITNMTVEEIKGKKTKKSISYKTWAKVFGMINLTHLLCRKERIYKESCKTRLK